MGPKVRLLIMADEQGNIVRAAKDDGDAWEQTAQLWQEEEPDKTVLVFEDWPKDFDVALYKLQGGKLVKTGTGPPSLEERLERIEQALLRAGLFKDEP